MCCGFSDGEDYVVIKECPYCHPPRVFARGWQKEGVIPSAARDLLGVDSYHGDPSLCSG